MIQPTDALYRTRRGRRWHWPVWHRGIPMAACTRDPLDEWSEIDPRSVSEGDRCPNPACVARSRVWLRWVIDAAMWERLARQDETIERQARQLATAGVAA